MFGPIRYRKGYKYQLASTISGQTPFRPEKDIDTEFIKLSKDGMMVILKGYAWDGASGPTFDTKNTFTPSIVHDAGCQLHRNGYLTDKDRKTLDKFFYDLLRERGMTKLRAKLWYRGVRFGAKQHPQVPKKVYVAP